MTHVISPLAAAILGVVEGLTEFLPVSSTGHLILTSHWLGIPKDNDGAKAFEVVIQFGALMAVFGIYFSYIQSMVKGLGGKDPRGLALVRQLIVGFIPAAVIGLLAAHWIKAHLFGIGPVVAALAAGGLLMLGVEYYRKQKVMDPIARARGLTLADMTWRAALLIGCAQCLAMWPGTSRSMITIVAALLLGFSPVAAAEFSFLLALPTLGAATAHDLLKDHAAILTASGALGLAIGFVVSFIVAWVAVKAFIAYLTRHGMAVFGWYRLALAVLVAWLLWGVKI